MSEKLFYLITAILISTAIPASASDVKELVVKGTKNNTPASVEVINLSDADRQVKTLSGILESSAGINITRYGTQGSYSTIYLRGTNANQLTVYIDGIPLSDSVFGEINFENIPIDSIERIEIYKNFAPLSFASPGIGGVINLVTKKDRRVNETGAALSAGSFNTYRLSGFHSYTGDASSLLVSGSATYSKGNFPFKNNNGTSSNPTDDFNDTRKNNNYKTANTTARYSYTEGKITIDALSDFFAKDQGVASYNNNASTASLTTYRMLNNAKLSFRDICGTTFSEQISVFANAKKETFNDPNNEIGYLPDKTIGEYLTYGMGSNTTYSVKNICQEFSLSIQGQNELYYLTKDDTKYSPQKRSGLETGLQDNITLFDKRVIITPLVRCDVRHDSFSDSDIDKTVYSVDPQAGAVIWAVKNLVYFKGSYTRNHRTPSFYELFGNKGTVRGNSSLLDETSDTYDVTTGITHTDYSSEILQTLNIEYSFFTTNINNIIIFNQNSKDVMVAGNLSKASITGHELTFQITAFDHIDLSGNSTLQFAKNMSDTNYNGNYLPFRPILECNSTAKIFNNIGSIAYQINYTGGNYRDYANSNSLYITQRIYHNIILVLKPRYDLNLTIEARNITNNQTLDVAGYPLPGRSFTGSVQYTF